MIRGLGKALACLTLISALSSCFKLDTEEEVRRLIRDWVFLAQTRDFTSRPTCTSAIFDTISSSLRSGPVRSVSTLRDGAQLLAKGQAVAFEVPGLTPNEVSEGLMSLDLSGGLGLVSSFVGPSRNCMSEPFQQDIWLTLMSPDSVMIYDPSSNALLLLHRPSQIAFFLRGNV
ncbi:hypothetical protein [Antarctobacter jejuensis]|uniref:hypothetical protein n=1 Tax=Antarctobacter jejuensis TaxID=1439938 RepID=UPI003FD49812